MADLTITVSGTPVPVHLAPAPDAVLDAAALAAIALKVDFADLAADEGAGLVGVTQDFVDAPAFTILNIFRSGPVALLHTFRKASDTTDTAAFTRAMTTGLPIYAQAGQGAGTGDDDGYYLIDDVYLLANTVLFGDGRGKTIIRPSPDEDIIVFRALSDDAASTLDNIHLRDLTLYGRVEDMPFGGLSEQVHLCNFSGLKDFIAERVEFKGFRGDGICFGSGEGEFDERHNTNLTVRSCIFNGINNDQRAGISTLDANGATYENCWFVDCTRSTMPGPINFEPNAVAFAVMKNITVRGCTFLRCGGNIGQVAVAIPVTVTASPRNINILYNSFIDYEGAGNEIAINTNRTTTATSDHSGVRIIGNYGRNGSRSFSLVGLRGVLVAHNAFEDYTTYGTLGFNGATDLLRDAEIKDNRFTLVGTDADLSGMVIGKADGLVIAGNVFDRCGAASGTGAAITFQDGVTSDNVTLEGNRNVPAASQTAAILATGHTFTPANNRHRNNSWGGLSNAFKSAEEIGLAALVAGVVTVTMPGVTASARIFVQRNTDGGTIGCSYSVTRTPGTSFTITSKKSDGTTETADTSTVAYQVEAAP